MSKLWYPGASRTQDFSSRYSGSVMQTNCVVLHSTEGFGWPGYSGGSVAPNATGKANFKRKRIDWRQHYAANRSARALVNLRGGVETNTGNCFQFELVGTCDPATHRNWDRRGIEHIYMPEAPDWFLSDLADFLKWLKDGWPKFRLEDGAPRGWVGPEKSPARLHAPQRMTNSEWLNFYGICGHQHVPENAHWDPGAFPIDRLVALATGHTSPSKDEIDMTPDELRQMIREEVGYAVWSFKNEALETADAYQILRDVRDTVAPDKAPTTEPDAGGEPGKA